MIVTEVEVESAILRIVARVVDPQADKLIDTIRTSPDIRRRTTARSHKGRVLSHDTKEVNLVSIRFDKMFFSLDDTEFITIEL